MYITTTVGSVNGSVHLYKNKFTMDYGTQTFKCIFTDWFRLVTKCMFWFL